MTDRPTSDGRPDEPAPDAASAAPALIYPCGEPPAPGTVREVAASADPVTRTYTVKVTLAAQQALDALPLGATVYVVPAAPAQAAAGVEDLVLFP